MYGDTNNMTQTEQKSKVSLPLWSDIKNHNKGEGCMKGGSKDGKR